MLTKRTLLLLAFMLSGGVLVASPCGDPETKTSTDDHGCYAYALAHQRQPWEGESYQVYVPVNGYFYVYFWVSPSNPEGHRAYFDRRMDRRLEGGSWVVFYSPTARTKSLGPGEQWDDWDCYPALWSCEAYPLGLQGTYLFRTWTQGQLRKPRGCTATIEDVVSCYFSP